jgi:cytidine deaminase
MEEQPYRPLSGLSDDDRALLNAAREVAPRAFNPVSGFQVGAAVRSHDGRVYLGTFLESSALPLGVCAEPAALLAALCDGVRRFAAIAVVGGDPAAPGTGRPVTPCGGCRQRIYDVTGAATANIKVLCSDLTLQRVLDTRITELLPLAFDPSLLPSSAWQPPPAQPDQHHAGAGVGAARPVAGRPDSGTPGGN